MIYRVHTLCNFVSSIIAYRRENRQFNFTLPSQLKTSQQITEIIFTPLAFITNFYIVKISRHFAKSNKTFLITLSFCLLQSLTVASVLSINLTLCEHKTH